MYRLIAIVGACALFLSGCAIHPLPENVTRDTTFQIVQKIRCEARQALDNLTVDLLRDSDDPTIRSYADRIEAGTLKATDLLQYRERYPLDKLPEKDKEIFLAYTLSAVTFDFQFTIQETNDNKVAANLSVPLLPQTFSVGGNAQATFDRKGLRKFFVTNTFYQLHRLDLEGCRKIQATVGNIVYPITGVIGLQEVFDTFIKIDSTAGSIKAPTPEHFFTDTLTFTTTFTGSINPQITLGTVTNTNVARLASASGTATETRVDAHQVAISIARGDLLTSYQQAELTSRPYSTAKAPPKPKPKGGLPSNAYLDAIRENARKKSIALAEANRVQFFFINQQQIYNRLNILSPY